jgi:CheY-like chemotaxis protein
MHRIASPYFSSLSLSSEKIKNTDKRQYQKTILWITENTDFQSDASRWKHQSFWVYDVFSALNQIEIEIPDVVICDANMTGLAGQSCLQLLSLHYPMLPVIALVDDEYLNRIVNFLREGVGDVLLKSRMDFAALTESVDRVFALADSISDESVLSTWSIEQSTLAEEMDDLMASPASVKLLFEGLLPANPMKQGHWACGYQLLQGDSSVAFMVDHVRLFSGSWLIYVVEVNLHSKDNVLTALSIRALISKYAKENAIERNLSDLPIMLKAQLGHGVCLDNVIFFMVNPHPIECFSLSCGLRLNRKFTQKEEVLKIAMSEPCIVQGKYDQICRFWLMPPSKEGGI